MSYIVYARKWRPQNFDGVVGQDNVVTTLKNAISTNRLAHAYIFAGPRGVGKTSTARILAKSLNCQEGVSVNPCNKCQPCLEITEGRSLDVIEIDGASNRGIDEIRTLRENVKFSPVQGKFKIYIIDEVHMLTSEAFNALLKTLEEPPPHVKFIFATTNPQKILATIVSRCQFLEFKRVSTITVIEKLKEIAKGEKIKTSDDVLLAIAKASDGSLRDAESVLDELVSFTGGNIKIADVHSVLGVVEQEFLFDITNNIIAKDANGCLKLLDKLIDDGKDPHQLLSSLIEHFRNLMIAKVTTGAREKLLDLPEDVCQVIDNQAKGIALTDIFFNFNELLKAQEMAKRIESLRIPLEIALVKMSLGIRPVTLAETLIKTEVISAQGPAIVSKPVFINQPKSDSSKEKPKVERAVADLDLENVKTLWPDFVGRLTKIKVSAAHYLEMGRPAKCRGSVLTLEFPKSASFQKESLERKENLKIVEEIWSDILGLNVKIDFTLSEEEEKKEPEATEADSLVQSALNTFGGRVVKKSF